MPETLSLSHNNPPAPPGQRNVHWQVDPSHRLNPVFSAHVRNTAGVKNCAEDYTAAAEDNGKLIVFSGTGDWSLLLPAPAPSGGHLSGLFPSPALSGSDQWAAGVSNIGIGSVQVVAVGCLLDGLPSAVTLLPGQSLSLYTDGADFFTTRGGGGGSADLLSEVPAGELDGVNRVFILSHAPDSGSLQLFVNGVEWYEGMHFTVDGAIVTFTLAPKKTDWLRATYAIAA